VVPECNLAFHVTQIDHQATDTWPATKPIAVYICTTMVRGWSLKIAMAFLPLRSQWQQRYPETLRGRLWIIESCWLKSINLNRSALPVLFLGAPLTTIRWVWYQGTLTRKRKMESRYKRRHHSIERSHPRGTRRACSLRPGRTAQILSTFDTVIAMTATITITTRTTSEGLQSALKRN
jgi:hypothetical protein